MTVSIVNKVDTKSVLSLLTVLALAGTTTVFKDEVFKFVRLALESDTINTLLSIVIVAAVFIHTVKIKDRSDTKAYIINSKFAPLDMILSMGSYLAVSRTATSLIEGAFIQEFYGTPTYFAKFNQLDIYVLIGVSGLLLWHVIWNMYLLITDIVIKSGAGVVDAVEEGDTHSQQ